MEHRLGPVLMACCVLLYVPFAGNYGLWDPWETHYGEVARQMAERHDYVSLWYPCSPIEGRWFWSKPVLTFWLIAPCLRLFGLQGAHAAAGELTDSWRAEWACRTPSLLLGLVGIWTIYALVRRIAGARAALCAGLVLATCPSWLLISRQAMTDMPFVVPMTIALCLVAHALLAPDDEPLPRAALGRLSWPRAPAYYALLASIALFGALQLAVISAQLHGALPIGAHRYEIPGVLIMAPYLAGLGLALWWCARARSRRQLYLLSAWVWCAVATLAKGPAGLAMPALVLVVHLVASRRWKTIFVGLELPRGALLFVVIAFPWYHAMLVRHGMPFWNELIGDNYIHRAMGRHGDRGTFEYYLQWLVYGTFPWSGLGVLAALRAFRTSDGADGRAALARYAVVWLLVDFVILTLVRTKFHHYLLPMVPAMAILGGLFLDELMTRDRPPVLELALVALPVTALCGVDLASLPQRLMWLFNYDYVNVPGIGRPWPLPSIYGDRYEYGHTIALFAALTALAIVALCWRGRTITSRPTTSIARVLLLAALALGLAIAAGPSTHGPAPTIEPWRWLVPLVLAAPCWIWLLRAGALTTPLALFVALAVAWSGFVADGMLVELSPHWSQKHVIAAYYAKRRGPEEPLIVWQLFWHGENFYTANEIYASPAESERTVFVNEHAPMQLERYVAAHPGRRVFFLVERVKLEALRVLLPPAVKPTLTILDESNNKLLLASARLQGRVLRRNSESR